MKSQSWGKTKKGQPYPKKKSKKEIKGLIKDHKEKLSTKKIGKVSAIKVLKGERNAIYKDSQGNLLVIDPRDNRIGLVDINGEYTSKEVVLQFIKDHPKQLKGKIMIKRGEISIGRRLSIQHDVTANKVIRAEHMLMKKKIPESEIHNILVEKYGATAKEIIDKEHEMMKQGLPEGKVHLALRDIYG